jgi:hypothetical protein
MITDDRSMGNKGQIGYPSDVTDEEWAFVAPRGRSYNASDLRE